MTDEDKWVGIRVAAIREAWQNDGKGRLTVREGIDALAGEGSPRHKTVRAMMREAATEDGFRCDDSDEPVLKVDTDAIDTSTTAWAIAAEEKAREQNDKTTTRRGDTEEARRDAKREAEETFDQIGRAATDGAGR